MSMKFKNWRKKRHQKRIVVRRVFFFTVRVDIVCFRIWRTNAFERYYTLFHWIFLLVARSYLLPQETMNGGKTKFEGSISHPVFCRCVNRHELEKKHPTIRAKWKIMNTHRYGAAAAAITTKVRSTFEWNRILHWNCVRCVVSCAPTTWGPKWSAIFSRFEANGKLNMSRGTRSMDSMSIDRGPCVSH